MINLRSSIYKSQKILGIISLFLLTFSSFMTSSNSLAIGLLSSESTLIRSTTSIFPPPTASDYQEKSSVVVLMNVTYQVKSTSSNINSVRFWMKRYGNHSSPTQPGVAPIQVSELLSTTYNLMNSDHSIGSDANNNSYEYFSFNLTHDQIFQYSALYQIRLSHMEWKIDDDISENAEGNFLHAYDYSGINVSDPWYQSLTQDENNFEVNNSALIELTYNICKGKPTLQEKIQSVLSWINENIEGEYTKDSQGAYVTYLRKKGDCSDFSCLFVTMLRILKVPARKVTGVQLFSPSGSFYPFHVGESFNYIAQKISNHGYYAELPGHAWVEYYHPNYGFISLDPTFARKNPGKYTNYIGYHYLTGSVGENYYEGIEPQLPTPVVGWGVLPFIKAHNIYAIRWNYTLAVEVEETRGYIWVPKQVNDLFPFLIGLPFSLLVLSLQLYRRKKRKKLEARTKGV
ncbi:MAG: transglutaminase family protein [Candidatus Hodarchaeota archaeon]